VIRETQIYHSYPIVKSNVPHHHFRVEMLQDPPQKMLLIYILGV